MGGSGLDRTDDPQKFCGSGLHRIQFLRIRIGLGLKNFTVSSSLLCVHFLSKAWISYGWIDDCSRSLNRSWIIRFEKLLDPDPGPNSKILEQERSRSLKQ